MNDYINDFTSHIREAIEIAKKIQKKTTRAAPRRWNQPGGPVSTPRRCASGDFLIFGETWKLWTKTNGITPKLQVKAPKKAKQRPLLKRWSLLQA